MATEVKQVITPNTERHTDLSVGDRASAFWSRNSKFIIYGVIAVVVLIGGYFGYKQFVSEPAEEKAAEAIWQAEQYFKMDSFQLALNGSAGTPGFLKVISNHGGTKSGNLAKFYAGASYLQLGDFNNAIKYLKDFSTDDKLVKLRATGLLGDAYSELGKKEEAIDYYRKAGTMFEADDINSPEYLFRAAMLTQDLGKNKEAIELLQSLREKYPNSPRAYEVDKYLGKLGETK